MKFIHPGTRSTGAQVGSIPTAPAEATPRQICQSRYGVRARTGASGRATDTEIWSPPQQIQPLHLLLVIGWRRSSSVTAHACMHIETYCVAL